MNFQQTLSPVNAPTYVSQGVSDSSLSKLVEVGASLGIGAYTGYQTSELQKELQGEVEKYFASEAVAQEKDNLAAEVVGQQLGVNTFWERATKAGPPTAGSVADIDRLQGELEGRLSKLHAMYEQSPDRMSINDLETRMLSTTRSFINKNPMLANELIRTTDKWMELSGMGSYIKGAQKIQKDQADAQNKQIEAILTQARQENIPTNPFNDNASEAMRVAPILAERMAQSQMATNLERMVKQNTFIETEAGKRFIKENGPTLHNGTLGNFQKNMASVLTNGRPWAEQKLTISNLARDTRKGLSTYLQSQGLSVSKDVQDWVKGIDEELKSIEEDLNTFGSGEDAAKYMENKLNVVRSQQELITRGTFNTSAIAALKDFGGIEVMNYLKQSDPETANTLIKTFGSLLLPGTSAAIGAMTQSSPSGKLPSTEVLGAITNGIAPTNPDKANKVLEPVVAAITNNVPNLQGEEKTRFFAETLNQMSRSKFDFTDASNKNNIQKFIGEALKDPLLGVENMYDTLSKDPEQTQVGVDPAGFLEFTGKNSPAYQARFGKYINDGLQSYANTYNMSVKEASAYFYPRYFPELKDEDIAEKAPAAQKVESGASSTAGREVHPTSGKPVIHNPDGSISTERTITIEADGKFLVLPTIINGVEYSPQEAISKLHTGENKPVGVFNSQAEADQFAVARSASLGLDYDRPIDNSVPTITEEQKARLEMPSFSNVKSGASQQKPKKPKTEAPTAQELYGGYREDKPLINPRMVASGSSTTAKAKETSAAAKVREFLGVPPPKDVIPVEQPKLTITPEQAGKTAPVVKYDKTLTGKWYFYGDSFEGALITDGKKILKVPDSDIMKFKEKYKVSPLSLPKWGK